jgi:CheY-like chemotaxis protein
VSVDGYDATRTIRSRENDGARSIIAMTANAMRGERGCASPP